MPRISQLPSLTVPDSGDELAIVDTSAATTKKISRTDFLKGAPLPTDTVTTAAIQDGAVTAPKIAQSVSVMGVVNVSTTGNKVVTGLGFRPRTVKFFYARDNSTGFYSNGFGFMTATIQRAYGGQFRTSASLEGAIGQVTNRCIYAVTQANAVLVAAERVSLDPDGFTINVLTTASYSEVWYEATL